MPALLTPHSAPAPSFFVQTHSHTPSSQILPSMFPTKPCICPSPTTLPKTHTHTRRPNKPLPPRQRIVRGEGAGPGPHIQGTTDIVWGRGRGECWQRGHRGGWEGEGGRGGIVGRAAVSPPPARVVGAAAAAAGCGGGAETGGIVCMHGFTYACPL